MTFSFLKSYFCISRPHDAMIKCLYLNYVYEEDMHSEIPKTSHKNEWNFSVPLLWFVRIPGVKRRPKSLDFCYGLASRGTTHTAQEQRKDMLRAEQITGRTGLGSHHTVLVLGSGTAQRIFQRIFAYWLTYLPLSSQACADKSWLKVSFPLDLQILL